MTTPAVKHGTAIEWTHVPGYKGETWNPITGCSRVSPGCDNCYAIRETHRFGYVHWKYDDLVRPNDPADTSKFMHYDWTGETRFIESELDRPGRWSKPRSVFVCSMSDLFHSANSWEDICRIFTVMADNPRHLFMVLTKRPGRMAYFANVIWPRWCVGLMGKGLLDLAQIVDAPATVWPANVWAGTTVESQKYVPRLTCLSRVPAPVRFVSVEPMLGPVDLSGYLPYGVVCPPGPTSPDAANALTSLINAVGHKMGGIDWVIVGGESGPRIGERPIQPMNPGWVRSIRDLCRSTNTPFFFKQWGEFEPVTNYVIPHHVPTGPVVCYPDGDRNIYEDHAVKVGKKAAGNHLNGVQHLAFPTTQK